MWSQFELHGVAAEKKLPIHDDALLTRKWCNLLSSSHSFIVLLLVSRLRRSRFAISFDSFFFSSLLSRKALRLFFVPRAFQYARWWSEFGLMLFVLLCHLEWRITMTRSKEICLLWSSKKLFLWCDDWCDIIRHFLILSQFHNNRIFSKQSEQKAISLMVISGSFVRCADPTEIKQHN